MGTIVSEYIKRSPTFSRCVYSACVNLILVPILFGIISADLGPKDIISSETATASSPIACLFLWTRRCMDVISFGTMLISNMIN